MKSSKAATFSREHKIPELRFDDGESQKLTSFAGLIVYQKLFADLDLRKRLGECFAHRRVEPIYGFHRIALLLIIHVVLGYRKLRDRDLFRSISLRVSASLNRPKNLDSIAWHSGQHPSHVRLFKSAIDFRSSATMIISRSTISFLLFLKCLPN